MLAVSKLLVAVSCFLAISLIRRQYDTVSEETEETQSSRSNPLRELKSEFIACQILEHITARVLTNARGKPITFVWEMIRKDIINFAEPYSSDELGGGQFLETPHFSDRQKNGDEQAVNRQSGGKARIRPDQSVSVAEFDVDALLCSVLRAKRILLVGAQGNYRLHSTILSALGSGEESCPGREFCNFHHICRPSTTIPESGDSAQSAERFRRPPSLASLKSTGSATLRFVLSETLGMDQLPDSVAYSEPQVDPETGVRVYDTYWFHLVEKSDIIVFGKDPYPAPTWTYEGSNNSDWCVRAGQSKLLENENFDIQVSIMDAALWVTLTKFLPSLLETLQAVSTKSQFRERVVVWLSGWYIQPQYWFPDGCELGNASISYDPWSFYHDSQIFLQTHLLRLILPYYNIDLLDPNVFDGRKCVNASSDSQAGEKTKKMLGRLLLLLRDDI